MLAILSSDGLHLMPPRSLIMTRQHRATHGWLILSLLWIGANTATCTPTAPCPATGDRFTPSRGPDTCCPDGTSVDNCPGGGHAGSGEVIVTCWVGGFCADEYLGGDAGCNYCVREEEWDAWIAASCPDCREECVFEDGLGGYLCWVVCDASGTK